MRKPTGGLQPIPSQDKPNEKNEFLQKIPENPGKMRFRGLGDLKGEGPNFTVNTMKRRAKKLRTVILLHFWTSNFSDS